MSDGCPCRWTTPCHSRCTCVISFSSQGCRRCCSYGSTVQREETAKHLARQIDGGHSPELFLNITDEDEGDDEGVDESPGGEWGFISLDKGRLFIRQSEIVGMKWIRDEHEDPTGDDVSWHLEVVIENLGKIHLYGEDCTSVMRVLGLPEEPPE